MATAGIGSGPHVYGALFNMMAGVDLVPVHYRGNPLPDLLAGQVQVFFGPIPASIGYIRADKLRALAVTSATRAEALPEIPTVAEFVPGYEATGWVGIGAPRTASIYDGEPTLRATFYRTHPQQSTRLFFSVGHREVSQTRQLARANVSVSATESLFVIKLKRLLQQNRPQTHRLGRDILPGNKAGCGAYLSASIGSLT